MPLAMVDLPAGPDRFSDIYIDETSHTKHRYLALGGIIVPTRCVPDLNRAVMQARLPELPAGELAWTKVSRAKSAAYRRVVDVFFDNPCGADHLDFHSIVVDTTRIDDKTYNAGSREIGFNKEIYQLGIKFGRLYRSRLFHIYPDGRTTPRSTEELRLILNRGSAKSGDGRSWPYRRLHFRDSSTTLPLQIVDLLLGGLAYRLNGHRHTATASPSKCELSDYILHRAGVSDVFRDTTRSGRFTIWHRQLRARGNK